MTEDSTIIGQVEPQEMQNITSLQTREQELTYRIGQAQREILSLAMQAGESSKALQQVMQGIRVRVGVPEGQLFRISHDGNVHLVSPTGVIAATEAAK